MQSQGQTPSTATIFWLNTRKMKSMYSIFMNYLYCLYNHYNVFGVYYFSFNNREMPARVQWQEMSMQVVPWVMHNSDESL